MTERSVYVELAAQHYPADRPHGADGDPKSVCAPDLAPVKSLISAVRRRVAAAIDELRRLDLQDTERSLRP